MAFPATEYIKASTFGLPLSLAWIWHAFQVGFLSILILRTGRANRKNGMYDQSIFCSHFERPGHPASSIYGLGSDLLWKLHQKD